ncbi:LOW QUALITY PROTEIN: hypothetical protein RJ639_024485 [Escallonia herrerae]|uniref:non-specific serine/threonine protein kinase n=1 Tax=Escallonia herrerae TaxID=1293975 RepID=A0AA88V045_9ASTE|nr:LOW QUALITY PROTEIN: hypothetical protein RJ639_024485 [Escallonia herrerae]
MLFVGLGWWYVFRKHSHEVLVKIGYMVLAAGFKSFSFAELKRATRNYKEQIGKGGFGTVYKGILGGDRVVAVKRLEGILQGETEFWAEVSIIGKLNHKNLATMRGFCAEAQAFYDYMENGSLDTLLFSSSYRTLGLDQRYNIGLGTAKGLAYIHEECLEWVLHCDVKPQNILLDHNLEPKVTDFGMSKFFGDSNNMQFSRVRGTRGYVAPEGMMNLKINAKADVYSYGVVLLELVSGKSASGFHLDEAQENKLNNLIHWARQRINQEGLKGIVDPRLNNEFDYEKLERLTRVALLCVAEDRDMRPAMSKVVELLTADGNSNLNPSEEIID